MYRSVSVSAVCHCLHGRTVGACKYVWSRLTGHVSSCLLAIFFFFLSNVRKQAIIIVSQMVATAFLAARNSHAPKTKMSGKVVRFPSASAYFISCLYVTINIYKQRKIAGKAEQGMGGGGTPHPGNDGGQVPGLALISESLKRRGKLLVTSLWNYIMLWVNERPPPKRNNKGRARGAPISVAVGLRQNSLVPSLEFT